MRKITKVLLFALLLVCTLSVSFADTPPDIKYTISSRSGANGSISPLGDIMVSPGENIQFRIRPNPGYRIKAVFVDGVSIGRVSAYVFTNVNRNRSISATFEKLPNRYHIDASSGPNGRLSNEGRVYLYEGSRFTYYVLANPGYKIKAVFVDGVNVGAVKKYTFDNVNRNHTIKAVFEKRPVYYNIVAVKPNNGSITPKGTIRYERGERAEYRIKANPGYRIKQVWLDNKNLGVVNRIIFVNISSSHIIRAVMEKEENSYNITAINVPNGSITPSGVTTVEEGESMTYNIAPNPGYHIKDVIVDKVSVGAVSSYTFANISSNHTIQPIFEKDVVKYLIKSNASEHGTISPLGSKEYVAGSSATYKIKADEGYKIENVIVDGVEKGALEEYTFTNINAKHTITATFVRDIRLYSINAIAAEGGVISPEGETMYTEGSSAVYSIRANEGYILKHLMVDGVKLAPTDEYRFDNITGPHTISAFFAEEEIIKYRIKAIAGEGGEISPEGVVEYEEGSSATYNIMPDEGYKVKELKVDGSPIGIVDKYVFKSINDHRVIEVTFEKKVDIEVKDGEYEVSADFKDASDISKTTVFKDAIKSSSVFVNKGEIKLITELKTFKIDGYDRNISRIKYYVDGLDSKLKEPVTITYGDIVNSFELPINRNKAGVYLRVYVDSIGFSLNTYMLVNLDNLKQKQKKKPPEKKVPPKKDVVVKPPEKEPEGDSDNDEDLDDNLGQNVDIEDQDKEPYEDKDRSDDIKDSSITSDDKDEDEKETEDKDENKETDKKIEEDENKETKKDNKGRRDYVVELERDETSGITNITTITIGLFSLLVVIGYYLFSAKR